MTPLQIALAAGGILVLAVVLGYNVWNERRSAPRRAVAHPVEVDRSDGAGAESRVEPLLDAAAPPGAVPAAAVHPALDALIDTIVPLVLERTPVAGETLLGALPPTWRVGSKAFSIEARSAAGTWEFPRGGASYDAVQAGMQLAGRTGALNDIEFSEFVVKVERIADMLGAAAEFPEMAHEIARARELDQFASECDARLGFMVRAHASAWSVGLVLQQAEKLGFVPVAVPGCMVLPVGDGGRPVLDLKMDAAAAPSENFAEAPLDQVTLGFDVPLIAQAERPLERLGQSTWALAEALKGTVTDETGRALHADALAGIGTDLERLYATLEQHGLPAGSPQAQRLFS